MAIELYEHNRQAYEQAVTMMAQTGKAAVIHPTGTGKSFIGFQLCAENPGKRICWLSPSEYIFKTQLENLQAAADGYTPNNIAFYTYAKLMLMSHEEMVQIQPDYIILDEFHRCGAQMWGDGVQRFLSAYPQVPLLGLTATNIRYLDNQRNMADELFDGNVASEMSLGEAIVRGILNPPKYVLSVFSYQRDLDKYQQRLRTVKSKATRDEGQKYLDALRRALEKADGLDEIFRKHMNATGKYIVFCANREHMQEMIHLAPEWFAQVDQASHIYSVYSDDPETDSAFAAFKADCSEHLKLLYCIDMLNEGVHVDDVDGVILLRPTISPIIYKQQIGRALSAGKKKNAVIFDIVLNIENLYSIGAIEEEMQIATTYYRSLGMDSEIINEQFQIVDEVRDCMELFEQLNDSLTASWELMYHYAKRYVEENGDLEVPRRHVTEEGYSLGAWIQTQRLVRAGKTHGILSDVQVKLLDQIGMRWESARDMAWEKYYAAARQYYEEHGNLLVNIGDDKPDGLALGRWIVQLRTYRRSNIQSAYLTPERISALNSIGMVWDVPDYLWERNFAAAVKYHHKYGNLDIPSNYVDDDGVRLGTWLFNVRAGAKKGNERTPLTADQIRRLDELGMDWEGKRSSAWDKAYAAACRYKKEHGDLNIPVAYKTDDGIALGRWIRRQSAAKLTGSRKAKLDAIGMVWKKEDPWMKKFQLLKSFYDKHGHIKMPADYVVEGVWLRRWLSEQIARMNGKSKSAVALTAEQVSKLESVGIRRGQLDVPKRMEATVHTSISAS